MLTDTPFTTAQQKTQADWGRSLRQPFSTKRLYEHLHLHCGFIAHYICKAKGDRGFANELLGRLNF